MNAKNLLPTDALLFVAQLAALRPPPASIWLIGSRANGRYRVDSDTDLLVFADQDFASAARASLAPPANIDVLVVHDGDHYADIWQQKTGSLRALRWSMDGPTRATYVGLKFVPDQDEERSSPLLAAGPATQLGEMFELNEFALRIWPDDG